MARKTKSRAAKKRSKVGSDEQEEAAEEAGGSAEQPVAKAAKAKQQRKRKAQSSNKESSRTGTKNSRCKVEGCTKQSKYAKCDHMCTQHFRASGGKFEYPTCKKTDCTRLSMGRRCQYMCIAHFKEAGGDWIPRIKPPKPYCSTEGCNKKPRSAETKGLCTICFKARNEGVKLKPTQPSCLVEGCEKQGQGKRHRYMCRKHYAEKYPAEAQQVFARMRSQQVVREQISALENGLPLQPMEEETPICSEIEPSVEPV